ncbi:MAG TPA: hypothetical protein VF629_23695 [Hymenobacter sp.]|jgi:amino acid permease|uniref:hypothetical protein n=1 Tax=Hymenobacter sp. TaxID=1898978 RepID=UPI002ED99D26
MKDSTVSIAVWVAVSLALYYLTKGGKRQIHATADGSFELRMAKLYQIIGLLGGIIAGIGLFLPLIANEYTTSIFVASSFVFMLFAALSTSCFLWYRNHKVKFNAETITAQNVYGKSEDILWKNIALVKFKPFAGKMEITDAFGKKISVHQHLVGFSTFIGELKEKRGVYNFVCESLPPASIA